MEQWYKDGEIYNSMTSIRNKMKEVSLPMLLTDSIVAELGFIKVEDVKPTITASQYLVDNGFTVLDGVPRKDYSVVDKSPEQLQAEQTQSITEAVNAWKLNRQTAVENIEVTHNTVIYQGDETSQTRMTRAIVALPNDTATIPWVAKDNSVHLLTKIDLQAILTLSGNAQSAIWTTGRPV